MLCYAILNYDLLCSIVMLCYAMLCYVMLLLCYCYAMLCYCYAMLCHAMMVEFSSIVSTKGECSSALFVC